MKIRTDFVTNSSSSSFIFREFNQEQVEKAVQRRLSVPPQDEWEEMDYKYVEQETKYIIGKRFKEYEIPELLEVYRWYHDEVLSVIVGVEFWKKWDERDNWKLKMDKAIQEKSYSDNGKKRLTAMFILDVYKNYFLETDIWNVDDKMKVVSSEFLNEQIWEYMGLCDLEGDELQQFYLDNIEKHMVNAVEFEGMLLAEVMECLLDAQYLYYSDMSIHYLICEILRDEGICLYACGHMG